MHETIHNRRTVRRYQQREVSREQLLQLLAAARQAPSPHNSQPWRFVVLRRSAAAYPPDGTHPRVAALAAAMATRWREHLAEDGQDEAVIAQRLERSQQRIVQAPALVLVCLFLGNQQHYPDAARQAAETTMATQSLGCAVQNMLLMARDTGLDTGWLCAPLFCPEVVRRVLALDAALIPHALITVGYAAEQPPARERLPLEDLVVWG
jgi:F420 biosynthesis protein FbiB-like protein